MIPFSQLKLILLLPYRGLKTCDEDVDPLAQGGGETLERLVLARGRCRTKGFVESFDALAENSCLLFSCTFKFYRVYNSTSCE